MGKLTEFPPSGATGVQRRCVVAFGVWPQKGHIYPTIHLAHQLRERGAEVIYFGSPDAEAIVRVQGFVCHVVSPDLADPILANKTFAEKSRFFSQLVPGIVERLKASGVTHLFVDPLVHVGAVAGLLAGIEVRYFWVMNPPYHRGKHLPFAYTFTSRKKRLARWWPKLLWLPQSLRWRSLLALQSIKTKDAMFKLVHKVAEERKVKRVLTSYGYRLDLPAIVLGPKRFEQWPDKNLTYLGLGVDQSRSEVPFVPPSAAPLVYVSLGGNFRLYRRAEKIIGCVLEVASKMPHLAFLVQAPPMAVRRSVSANVTVVTSAPTLAVLARASAAIIHGGFGTIKECILYQVPMLIVPFLFDQPANATKIEELGLGVVVESKHADASRLRRGLELLLKDPEFPETSPKLSRGSDKRGWLRRVL